MFAARDWPMWGKMLVGVLTLYSLCLCVVSLSALVISVRRGFTIKASDVLLQVLMTVFFPWMLLGLWRARLASGLLFAGVAADLVLLLAMSQRGGDGAGTAMLSSVAFLGAPMLGAGVVYRSLCRMHSV